MECYEMNGLSGIDPIVETAIDDLMQEWSTDELINLLGECESALAYNEGRIDQLKAKGLKRLSNIIIGINRKNEQIVRDNVQSIQQISLNIQKILLKRIDIVHAAYESLNDKVNEERFWTRDIIKRLLPKLKNVSVEIDMLKFQGDVRNRRTKNESKYLEASNGVKILLVVSDLFNIVYNQIGLIEEATLETILIDKLEMPSQIKTSDFYRDIISDEDCLTLYVKEEYNCPAGDISDYGKRIYNIHDFYLNYYVKVLAQQQGRTIKDLCMEAYGTIPLEEDETIRSSDLCWILLEDLADLYNRYQKELKKTATKPTILEPPKETTVYLEPSKETTAYSVLRITPEGRWLFRDNTVSYNETDFKYDYSFLDEKSIKTYLDDVKPYMVTAPSGYFYNCVQEIKSYLLYKTKYVSLADYYMYLWFRYKSEMERKGKKIVFIEYYEHYLYVSGYVVDTLGNEYRKGFSRLKIIYNRIRGHIIRDIKDEWKESFPDSDDKDITIYRTFTSNKHIDRKLDDVGVGLVETSWEDILKVDNGDLGHIIKDMIRRSDEKQQSFRV